MSGTFRRQVQVFIDRNLTPAAQSARLAKFAIEGRDDLIKSGRASPSYTTFVDGQRGASEARVKPDGAIVYRFNVLGEAAVFAYSFLRTRSPYGGAKKAGRYPFDGNYRDQFVYSVSGEGNTSGSARGTSYNGSKVAASYRAGRIILPASFDPTRIDGSVSEILITNRSPYARRVDTQLVGGKRLSFSVPPGIFDDAAAAVRKRFPTLDARRIYTVSFPRQYTRRTGPVGRTVENPALVISVRG